MISAHEGVRRLAVTLTGVIGLCAMAATAHANTIVVPNDAATIGAAVALASNGDKIVILGGSYDETVEVNGLSDLTIKARAGASLVRPAAGPTPLTLRDCTRVKVIGLAIVGGFYGVDVFDSADIKIAKCDIRAGDGDGIRVFDSARVKVANCQISDRKQTGVYIAQLGASPPTSVQVAACSIVRSGLFGVLAQHGSDHAVLRCRIFDTGLVGIELNSNDGLIESNKIVRTTTLAALAVRGDNNVARNNRAKGAGKEGFYVGGTNAVIEKNQFRDCFLGIWCPGASNTIRKNVIDTTESWGIIMTSGEDNVVERNTVIAAGSTALRIDSHNGDYRSNKLKLGKSFGVDLVGDGNEIVSNTTVMSAGTAFVVRATASGNTIALNRAKKNLGSGLDDLSAPGTNTFLDNEFTGF